MSKIMVIAGGTWQCPIVQTAKNMGHFVICTNLYQDSPAFAYADIGEVADVLDKEKNLEIAKKYQPDAVLTDQSDIAVPTVAYIAENLGLKGIGIETSHLYTNKYLMREFCRKYSFPHPEYRLCHTLAEAEQFLQEKKKAIIKPLDSQSSRGVHVVETARQLKENFSNAMRYSNTAAAVLIEQYIEGKEFTVDGFKDQDSYFVTAISKKKHFHYNRNIAKELLFSNYDDEYDYEQLRQINKEYVFQTQLPFGLTHAEYKYMDGKFYLIEIAARGGGTKISSDIVPFMSGINSNQSYIHMLLGNNMPHHIKYDKDRYAVLGFLDLEQGTVSKICGLEQAMHVAGVQEIKLDFSEGDTIAKAEDDRSRLGYYIITADSYQKLREREKEMHHSLKIIYQNKKTGLKKDGNS